MRIKSRLLSLYNINHINISALLISLFISSASFGASGYPSLDSEFEKSIYIKSLNILENTFPESSLDNSFLKQANELVAVIKKEGMLVDGFKIDRDDINKVALPFIVYLAEKGWMIIQSVNEEGVSCLNPHGALEEIPNVDFFNKWNGYIISKIIMNTLVYKMPFDASQLSNREKTVVVYLNHDKYDKPDKIGNLLDNLVAEAKEWEGGEIIYVDELGLIPEDTVENSAKTKKISREEAFGDLKNTFQKEIDQIKLGKPLYDPSYFYNEFYKYLAKYKVQCYIEDLKYKLWEFIVAFDDFVLFREGLDLFVMGAFSDVFSTTDKYQSGYSAYNIKIRDEHFIDQLKSIRDKYPKAIILTIRGLGHYGFDEALVRSGEIVQNLVIGNDEFIKNFAFQQLAYILEINNVSIQDREKELIILKTFPQELLRFYLDTLYSDINYSTKVSFDAVSRLDINDLSNFSIALKKFYLSGSKKISLSVIGEFTFNWLKENGFISEEEIKAIPN